MLVYWKYLIESKHIGKEAVRAIAGTLLVNLIMGATNAMSIIIAILRMSRTSTASVSEFSTDNTIFLI